MLDLLATTTGHMAPEADAPTVTAGADGAEARAATLYESETFAAAWRAVALELGGIAGFPALPFAASRSVTPGEYGWRLFTTRASVADLVLVVEAARAFVAAFPTPPEDVIPAVPTAETLTDGTPANRCPDCSQPCGTAYRCSSCAARRVHPEDR